MSRILETESSSKKKRKIKSMKDKLYQYENLIKELIDDIENIENEESDSSDDDVYNPKTRILDRKSHQDIELVDDFIVERDIYGNTHKSIQTDSGNTFVVIDNGKDLEEINKVEYNAIHSQEDFYKYEKTREYCNKVGTAWGWGAFVIGMGRLAISFF